jgi:hypothetical protein
MNMTERCPETSILSSTLRLNSSNTHCNQIHFLLLKYDGVRKKMISINKNTPKNPSYSYHYYHFSCLEGDAAKYIAHYKARSEACCLICKNRFQDILLYLRRHMQVAALAVLYSKHPDDLARHPFRRLTSRLSRRKFLSNEGHDDEKRCCPLNSAVMMAPLVEAQRTFCVPSANRRKKQTVGRYSLLL